MEVVDAAIGAFLVGGYDGTPLARLEEATGVDRSTLYNSFGGKSGLFASAAERYLDMAEERLFGPLHVEEGDPLDALTELFERLRRGVGAADDSPGCLMVNDMVGGSLPAATDRYRSLLEGGLRAALVRAEVAGIVTPDQVEPRVQILAAAVLASNLVARQSGDASAVGAILDGAIATIDDWR